MTAQRRRGWSRPSRTRPLRGLPACGGKATLRSYSGFTLIELVIVLTISTIVVPIVFAFGRHLQDQTTLGHWHLETADAIRTVAEELRADARAGEPAPISGDAVAFTDGDGCTATYRVAADDAALIRSSTCEPDRGLSRFVESIAWSAGGVDVVFARAVRPARTHRATIFIPVESP